MKSANIRYLPGLDHLRAFAALLIVFYHGLHVLSMIPRGAPRDFRPLWILPRKPFTVLLQDGHTAVALFMVLSGFVFTLGCLGRDVAYWPFLKNRFLRIYPLFVVMLVVGVTAIPAAYSLLGVLQTLLFQSNLGGATNAHPFTAMFWAVGVEFQFYLLFPFLHRFLEREGIKWAVGLIILATALRFLAVKCGATNARDISYAHILGRIDQFLIGMVAARVYHRVKNMKQRWWLWSLAAFTLVLAAMVGFSVLGSWESLGMWKISWPTVEGLAWACFIVCYVCFANAHSGRWSLPLEHIGSWSYSIYLLHFVLLVALPTLIPLSSLTPHAAEMYTLRVVMPILLPLSALSYYVIERPFLQMRVRYLREREEGSGGAVPEPGLRDVQPIG